MRFIARYGRYSTSARRQISEHYATGQSRVIQSELIAQFKEGQLTPEERALAVSTWTFNGFYQEQDEVTQVAPDYRIGLFDSVLAQAEHGWSDEECQMVEDHLIKQAETFPTTLIVVGETRAEPPWPNYDVFTGSLNDLCTKIVEDGYSLDAVLAYEEANQDRPEVVRALKALLDDTVTAPRTQQVEEVVG